MQKRDAHASTVNFIAPTGKIKLVIPCSTYDLFEFVTKSQNHLKFVIKANFH